ncbi:MAG: amino acid permease [Chitinivibrionales bacterium]|nr:amino acid permease [Chitinivibrionales bacterium]
MAEQELRRELGLAHLFALATGAMISSGLFVLPGLAHAKAGPAVIVSYFLAGLLAAPGMLSVAELSSAMPRAGGAYFFISRSLGPAVGTVAGLLTWFSLSLKGAFALVGMAAFVRLAAGTTLPPGSMQIIPLGLCLVFVVLNLVGVRESAKLEVWLTTLLLGCLAVYVAVGLPSVDTDRLDPVAPHGLSGIVATAGFVFVSYGGLLTIVSVAEEVRNPGRLVPLSMILSLLIVSALYTLVVLVTSGVLPDSELDNSLTPISDGAGAFMGAGGTWLMAVAAMMAFITTANAGLLAASRYLLALSRDRFLPSFLRRVNLRFQTPHYAVLATGGFMAVALLLDLRVLVSAASTVLLLSYLLQCFCVIVLREGRVQNYRPVFRAPFYPWLQLLGIFGFALLLMQMGFEAFAISAGLVLAGFVVYWAYGRRGTMREYALLHLLERLTSRELVTGTLESELKQIIRERDEITIDRFDALVETCPVLDLHEPLSRDGYFERASGMLAPRLGVSGDELRRRLVTREEQGSTVVTRHVAIPHIVFDASVPFDMLITRSRPGVAFTDESSRVSCIIVLVGSRAERGFHLRCLAAIAQIVQSAEFEERWQTARGEQAIRDTLLLANRQRLP